MVLMPAPKMTPKQLEVLAFVSARVDATGHFPRTSEIMRHVGWKDSRTVIDILHRLERRGLVCIVDMASDGHVRAWSLPHHKSRA